MPYKHFAKCYRTIGGVEWPNMFDVLGPEHRALIEEAKRLKLRHRLIKHDHGDQLFVHPDDVSKLSELAQ